MWKAPMGNHQKGDIVYVFYMLEDGTPDECLGQVMEVDNAGERYRIKLLNGKGFIDSSFHYTRKAGSA